MTTTQTESAQDLRKRAEEKYRGDEGRALQPLSTGETKKILHELQVHQIELEMQNEELQLSREDLEESRASYFDLYDLAPVGYLTLSNEGVVLKANLAAATMLGVERAFLIQKQMSRFIFPQDQDVYFHHRKLLIDTCELRNWEMRLKRVDGSPFFAELRATLAQNGECWITLADITLRKQLESEIQNAVALQCALEYAENIVETLREPLLVLDSNLKILSANSSFYSTFMVTAEETIGNFIYDLGSRQWDIPQLRVLLEEILPQETVLNGYIVDHDFLGIGRKTILLNARQIFREDIGSHIILLAMEDITERKLAEKGLQEKNEIISQLAVTDELTGLNNRRFFNESLAKAVSAARRHRQPLSLISIDIDHFKKVNDTYGHTMGDLILKEFSLLLKMMVRVEDIACRWGGEEFIVLLPNTTCEAAVILADRMRSSFEQYPRTTTPVVTASFGVAQLQEGEDEDALMKRVDDALYQAKHEGRNRVVAACDTALA